MKKKLSIIIVHWNTPEKLKYIVGMLKNTDDYQIIVIDNSSSGSLYWFKNEFPYVNLIQNKFNRGYSFACNQGAIKAVGEWLFFLNPDVEITLTQISELLNHCEKNNLDACSVKTNESYQKPLPSALSFIVEFSPINRLVKKAGTLIGIDIFPVKTLFGGCLLLKKQVLKSLGGWDERFFIWFEDSDLTARLIKNNFKIGWLNLKINHSGGESFKKLTAQLKRDIFFQSMEIFARKHLSLMGRFVVNLLKYRYTDKKILPALQNLTSIIVPNLKLELLTSFLLKNEKILNSASGVEWVVVTSALKNSKIWSWRKKYPEIRFIPIDKNDGFVSTVNVGFRVSSGDRLGTINDDVLINADCLGKLLVYIDKSVGSVNPIIKNTAGGIESVGIKVLAKGKAEPINKYNPGYGKDSGKYIKVDATNAAAVIYSKESLLQVGIFDEKFGSYLEDIDLSLRLNRSGYKNIVSLSAEVIHSGQSTSRDLGWRKQYSDFKNWILIIFKNWGYKQILFNFPAIIVERFRNISGVIKSLL